MQFSGQRDVWQFDRAAIHGGDWWLVLTGNVVHLSTGHLGMNLLGLYVIVLLAWHHMRSAQWIACFAVSAVAVGGGLYLRDPHLDYYVGLSGVLHGLLLTGIVLDIIEEPRNGWVLLIAISAKLGWEQWHGAVPGSAWAAGGNVVVNSHLYGAVAGVAFGLVVMGLRGFKPTRVVPPA